MFWVAVHETNIELTLTLSLTLSQSNPINHWLALRRPFNLVHNECQPFSRTRGKLFCARSSGAASSGKHGVSATSVTQSSSRAYQLFGTTMVDAHCVCTRRRGYPKPLLIELSIGLGAGSGLGLGLGFVIFVSYTQALIHSVE